MSSPRKKPPRPSAAAQPPICDHCRKRCGKGTVRTKDGVFCSPKHRDARVALLRTVEENNARPVDVGAAIETALARRGATAPARAIVNVPVRLSGEQENIIAAWLEAKSPDTVRCYKQWLASFVGWMRDAGLLVDAEVADGDAILGLLSLGPAKANWILQRWINAQVAEGRPHTTYAKVYAAVRSFCTTLRNAGLADFVPSAQLPKAEPRSAIETKEKYGHVPPSYFAMREGLERMVTKDPGDVFAIRDLAILVTGRELGARRIEIVRFDVGDFDFQSCIYQTLRKGRRKKIRKPLPSSIVPILRGWMRVRSELIGKIAGPLFVSLRAGTGERLKRGSINAIMTRRAEQLGVKLTPHDLRRIFCTRAIQLYGLNRAKGLTDHKNVATLEIYDIAQGDQLAEMAEEVARDE